jgi:hypothetical protein
MLTMNDLYVAHFAVPGGVPLDERDSDGDEEDQEPDVKTTFAHFGLAYYQACVLEHEVVNVLAMNRATAARRDAERLLSDPWADTFKKTMGVLVKQLWEHTIPDPELAADLVKALQLRNHLAHGFWRDRADDFCTDDGRARMIAYLIEARKHFQDVDQRLSATIGASTLVQGGVTPEVIDAWYRDMVGQVERGESNVPLTTIESTREHMLSRVTQSDSTQRARRSS